MCARSLFQCFDFGSPLNVTLATMPPPTGTRSSIGPTKIGAAVIGRTAPVAGIIGRATGATNFAIMAGSGGCPPITAFSNSGDIRSDCGATAASLVAGDPSTIGGVKSGLANPPESYWLRITDESKWISFPPPGDVTVCPAFAIASGPMTGPLMNSAITDTSRCGLSAQDCSRTKAESAREMQPRSSLRSIHKVAPRCRLACPSPRA